MGMAKKLSMEPDAVRMRAFRKRRKAARAASVVGSGAERHEHHEPATTAATVDAVEAVGAVGAIGLHATEPEVGPGADSFAAVPNVPVGDQGSVVPVAPPVDVPPPPPPPPPTPDEVAILAEGVAAYFEAGIAVLLSRHADELARVVDVGMLASKLPAARSFVHGAAQRVAIKYSLRLPYQDELIVAGAIGLATFGMFGGKVNTDDAERARVARDATPRAAPNGVPNRPPSPSDPLPSTPAEFHL